MRILGATTVSGGGAANRSRVYGAFLIALLLGFPAPLWGRSTQISLLTGISRLIEFPKGFGAIHLNAPDIVQYRREPRKGKALALYLLPLRPGVAEIRLHGRAGGVNQNLIIRVIGGVVPSVLEAQKRSERKEGLTVRDLTLKVGQSEKLQFPGGYGPLYLTDPQIIDYAREGDAARSSVLTVMAKGVGLTDLVVHDRAGVPKFKYYVRVDAP